MKIRKKIKNSSITSVPYFEKLFNFKISMPSDYYNIKEYTIWLSQQFGLGMYEPFDDYKNGIHFELTNINAVWDHWGINFYFKNKNDALLFKVAFGGEFHDLKKEIQ